jgi:hypothetical protein
MERVRDEKEREEEKQKGERRKELGGRPLYRDCSYKS